MLLLSTVSTGNQEGTETDVETTENSSVKRKEEKKRKKEKKKQRLETETEHKKKHKKCKKYKLKEETWLSSYVFCSGSSYPVMLLNEAVTCNWLWSKQESCQRLALASTGVRLSRDFSRLPQIESLSAG